MPLVLVMAVAGGIIGLLSGGSLSALAETKFRWSVTLFVGLALQILFGYWTPAWTSEESRFGLLIASNAAVAIFLAKNWRLPGMLVAALGLVLNVTVISANGAMPVSPDAARDIGATAPSATGFKHERLDESTRVGFLGDVIAVPAIGFVLSIGDVFLGLGIFYLVFARTRAQSPGRHSRIRRSSG